MNETVTVDEAIAKGQRMVNYPVVIIMVGTMILSLYLGIEKIFPGWIIPAGFVLAFVLSWIYWSVMITKWKVWAFDNVRNVHQLKKMAIGERLIWPENSFFQKTEIWSLADKEKWMALQDKFNIEDLFVDDITVPNETIIYYSKGKNYVEMAVMLCFLAGGIYLMVALDNYIVGGILSVVGAFLGYREYRQATNTEAQIIINDKGIKTASTDFFEWSNISNEVVIRERSGKHSHDYLKYDHPNGSVRLLIDDFDTDRKSLNTLLILYRGRSMKRMRHH